MANSDRESLERTWSMLESTAPKDGGKLPFRELGASTAEGRVLAALDGEGRRLLLLPASPRMKCPDDEGGSGITTGFKEWSVDGRTQRFYFLQCRDGRLSAVFCRVAEAVAERLDEGRSACRAVADVLSEFRDLLKRPRPRLSREEQLGLIGELSALRSLLIYDPGALSCWVGPRGSRHDFTSPGVHVEVKASFQQSAGRLRIHGVDQLNPEGAEQLYLLHYTFDETPGTELTIPELAKQCRASATDKEAFDELLVDAGAAPDVIGELDLSVSFNGRRLYRVDESFPKLVPSSFDGGVPAGVAAIDYTIDLSSAASCLVADESTTNILKTLAAHGAA